MSIREDVREQIQAEKFSYALIFIVILLIAGSAIVAGATYKQNQALDLKYSCLNTTTNSYCNNLTYCNATILSPDNSVLVNNLAMTYNVAYFNYTLSSSQTATTGEYSATVLCIGTTSAVSTFTYEITPSGFERTEIGSSITLIGGIFIIFVLGILLFFGAFKAKNVAAKISFFSLSAIFFIIAILYIIVAIQQTLWGYENLITGIETFWSVAQVMIGIGILVLLIVVSLILFKAWKIKRGYYDVD